MGAVEAEHKSVSPTTKMVFLGVLFDTEKFTLEVYKERVGECRKMLDDWLDKREVRRKENESLVGKLAFVAACVRPGQLFMLRVLEFFCEACPRSERSRYLKASGEICCGGVFLPQYNGVSMMRGKSGRRQMRWWRRLPVYKAVGHGFTLSRSISMHSFQRTLPGGV